MGACSPTAGHRLCDQQQRLTQVPAPLVHLRWVPGVTFPHAGWGWGTRMKSAVIRGCVPVIVQDGIKVGDCIYKLDFSS